MMYIFFMKNEYLSEPDERIKFLTQFTGSNATAIITLTEALVWTDGRYYIQAEKQLSSDWKMMKMEKGNSDVIRYIKENIIKYSTIGIDTNFISIGKICLI